jgi:hypothetical protein
MLEKLLPADGGRSVGIVRSRTQATEFFLDVHYRLCNLRYTATTFGALSWRESTSRGTRTLKVEYKFSRKCGSLDVSITNGPLRLVTRIALSSLPPFLFSVWELSGTILVIRVGVYCYHLLLPLRTITLTWKEANAITAKYNLFGLLYNAVELLLSFAWDLMSQRSEFNNRTSWNAWVMTPLLHYRDTQTRPQSAGAIVRILKREMEHNGN